MDIKVSMPSNIALVKYMGKSNIQRNQAANHSISLTLPQFQSTCEVSPSNEDEWINHPHTPLSHAEQNKVFRHIKMLKSFFQYDQGVQITCYNNFPKGVGIASSASSMAAITQACAQLMAQQPIPTDQLARLSQQGSGSSCRSFYHPFAVWQDEHIKAIDCPFDLFHQVVLLDSEQKKVSSSQAHQIISQSKELPDRIQRANRRVTQLLQAIQSRDWETMRQVSIADSKDMHTLLEQHGIHYRTEASHVFFKQLDLFQKEHVLPVITTMDAGPNIHLIGQTCHKDLMDAFFKKFQHYKVL